MGHTLMSDSYHVNGHYPCVGDIRTYVQCTWKTVFPRVVTTLELSLHQNADLSAMSEIVATLEYKGNE